MCPVRSHAPGEGAPRFIEGRDLGRDFAPRSPVSWRQVYDFSTASQGSVTLTANAPDGSPRMLVALSRRVAALIAAF
jgi:hypothetical protein